LSQLTTPQSVGTVCLCLSSLSLCLSSLYLTPWELSVSVSLPSLFVSSPYTSVRGHCLSLSLFTLSLSQHTIPQSVGPVCLCILSPLTIPKPVCQHCLYLRRFPISFSRLTVTFLCGHSLSLSISPCLKFVFYHNSLNDPSLTTLPIECPCFSNLIFKIFLCLSSVFFSQ
jgi:hypothetical protein